MVFKMKGPSLYRNSPIEQDKKEGTLADGTKYTVTDSDAVKKQKEKEEEKKKKDQLKIQQQIEGTYVQTEEDIKRRKEDFRRNRPKRK
mgnify:CR=1 FL=1|tara:strand:+ start:60 stop:323 length:264 start_codon:yes stop_codon:yes gene_type:complete